MNKTIFQAGRFILSITLLGSLTLAWSQAETPPPTKETPKKTGYNHSDQVLPLTVAAWQKVPLQPLQTGEIDRLVMAEYRAKDVSPVPLISDEQFIRRVTLDLTGQLPLPADVDEFVADKDSQKRAKFVNQLLDSEEYARHWSKYWRDVVSSRLTELRVILFQRVFEEWMFQQLKANRGWGDIAKEIITAEGGADSDNPGQNGNVFFLAAHFGADAINERTAETSRVFLGIQLQCAQCHDHPSDQWKRIQFHEMAAFFARLRDARNPRQGVAVVSVPRGEHQMPSKEDPKKTTTVLPRFLTGKAPTADLDDKSRRLALAQEITDKENFWFAAAFVNRMWNELMGQGFYMPVDDMGPGKDVVFPSVLARLTGSFRASNYDIKGLLRDIVNTQTYQRQSRLNEATTQHLNFATVYPTRLRAEALWQSLVNVLGNPGGGPRGPNRPNLPFARGGLEGAFKQEFDFDPSVKSDDVEGSVPQALIMMNNPAINQRIKAVGTNLLGRILSAYDKEDEALKALYLRVLARKPTDRELEKSRGYIKKTGNRAEAYEDILWALLNSTEFLTKR